MIITLSIIFLILLLLIGKRRGLKTYLCFYINYFLIIMYVILVSMGINPLLLAIINCLIVSIVTLFLLNGNNIKTLASFLGICIVLIIEFILIYFISINSNLYGFSYESMDSIGVFSFDIHISMEQLFMGVILMSTIGTVIDTSISISSALKEVYVNNPKSNIKELYYSGINIGKDILSTTISTLYFAFLCGFIGFLFWHTKENFGFIINYKVFALELVELLCCFIGSILIIPITTIITAYLLRNKKINNLYK